MACAAKSCFYRLPFQTKYFAEHSGGLLPVIKDIIILPYFFNAAMIISNGSSIYKSHIRAVADSITEFMALVTGVDKIIFSIYFPYRRSLEKSMPFKTCSFRVMSAGPLCHIRFPELHFTIRIGRILVFPVNHTLISPVPQVIHRGGPCHIVLLTVGSSF